jgi:hypothetical protein
MQKFFNDYDPMTNTAGEVSVTGPTPTHGTRFIGARSYEEKDKFIFFGRTREIDDLFQLININTFTLLYGRSGLGKTSVLNAGVFPKLRTTRFLPVYIKPDYSNTEKNYIKWVEDLLTGKNEHHTIGEDYVADPIKSKESLWEYFQRHPIRERATGKEVLPVLVFDQFEEIFTLGTKDKSSDLRQNVKDLVECLSDLIENIPPGYLSEDKRLQLQYKHLSGKTPVKVLFSFREEYLSDFYALSKYIPSIAYSNLQYRLGALTFDSGYEIIKKASAGLFSQEAILETLRAISEANTIADARGRDIDSFLLSIFCESQIDNSGGETITKEQVEKVNIQDLVSTLYRKAVNELNLNPAETKLLEEKLITTEGFRLPVYLKIALSDPAVRMDKVQELVNRKIIKRYSVDGKPVIEIIHDKYAEAAKKERDFKIKVEQEKLQLLKDQEDLNRKKLEDEKRMAEEKAQFDRERAEAKLKLEKDEALLKAKAAVDKQLILAQQVRSKNKWQRRLIIAGSVALAMAAVATSLAIQSSNRADEVLRQADLIQLYNKDSLSKAAALTRSLAEVNQSLRNQFLLSDSLRKSRELALDYATRNRILADSAKRQAMQTADSLQHLLGKLQYQKAVSDRSKTIGLLLASAQRLQYTNTGAAYATYRLALSLDSTDKDANAQFHSFAGGAGGYYSTTLIPGEFIESMLDQTLLLLEARPGDKPELELKYHSGSLALKFSITGQYKDAQISPDSQRILIETDRETALWDVNGQRLAQLPEKGIDYATFSDLNSTIATVTGNKISIWNYEGQLVNSLAIGTSGLKVSSVWLQGGRLFVNTDAGLMIHDLLTMRLLYQSPKGVDCFMIPRSDRFLTIDGDQVNIHDNTGYVVQSIAITGLTGKYARVGSVVFSSDGREALAILGNVLQSRGESFAASNSFVPVTSVMINFAFASAFAANVSYDSDGDYAKIPPFTSVSFSPDGRLLAANVYSENTSAGQIAIFFVYPNKLSFFGNISLPEVHSYSIYGNSVITSSFTDMTTVWQYGSPQILADEGKFPSFSTDTLYKMAGVKP